MQVRSRSILALALVLLAAATALGWLATHDGERADTTQELLRSEEGEAVVVKAEVRSPTQSEWSALVRPARNVLSNHTYVLSSGPDHMVLGTALEPVPPDGVHVLHGRVALTGSLDDGRALVVVTIERADAPLVFG